MGSGELYNLRWNDFQSCFSTSVRDLLEEKDFTDVTLAAADGQNFPVHKVVLSVCSLYFKKILKVGSIRLIQKVRAFAER